MKRFASDIKKYWNYMVYEAKSQLKAEVANSYLNWIWWILEPLCLMLIYAFVFGFLFKHKEENYNVFKCEITNLRNNDETKQLTVVVSIKEGMDYAMSFSFE